ncbi:E3 ubiquitin/ISG15 ligase TRIM25 isoform X2 [Nerophis ophidion]|uniref:E3 ubiquitin/ISG15 ligase TRIM25 isoform X2 n=1 Tax=Nerophis ophidion TaxID=159077 RepID=UPI002ADF120D|nr:E3 ubiquitin/ISG15 ligase TRIM25 isoform X2 [Nerophis ophidion]
MKRTYKRGNAVIKLAANQKKSTSASGPVKIKAGPWTLDLHCKWIAGLGPKVAADVPPPPPPPSAPPPDMASGHQVHSTVLQEELTCPVCLDVYRDPLLLPCGHNFCRKCLDRLRQETERSRFRCPECRDSHSCSMHLQRNFKLGNIADDFRSSNTAAAAKECVTWTGPKGSVPCDYCLPPASTASSSSSSASPEKGDMQEGGFGVAVKMCLKCEVSMCQEHVKPHLELPVFRDHLLTETICDFWKRKCPDHDEFYRYYCVDDKVFVCNSCTIEGRHQEHAVRTMKNTMKDMKESLHKQLGKVVRKQALAKKRLQEQNQKDRQREKFLQDSEEHLAALRETLEGKVLGFMGRLMECTRTFCDANGTAISKNISRIHQDLDRLQEAQSGIQDLLQEKDPFCFIEASQTTGRRCTSLLRKNIFYPKYVDTETAIVSVMMEEEMRKFVEVTLRREIMAAINSICQLPEEEEGEQTQNEEVTRETDDDDDDDDDVDDDEDDVLDDSSEEMSEEEEHSEGHDGSDSEEDVYIPEDDDDDDDDDYEDVEEEDEENEMELTDIS